MNGTDWDVRDWIDARLAGRAISANLRTLIHRIKHDGPSWVWAKDSDWKMEFHHSTGPGRVVEIHVWLQHSRSGSLGIGSVDVWESTRTASARRTADVADLLSRWVDDEQTAAAGGWPVMQYPTDAGKRAAEHR